MMEETTIPATDREVPSSKESYDTTILNEPIHEKTDVEPAAFELHDHEQHIYPNISAKNANMPSKAAGSTSVCLGIGSLRMVVTHASLDEGTTLSVAGTVVSSIMGLSTSMVLCVKKPFHIRNASQLLFLNFS